MTGCEPKGWAYHDTAHREESATSAVVVPPLPPATSLYPALVAADEFPRLHGDESGIELVNGRTVRLSMPGAQLGEVCLNAGAIIREFVKRNKLGRAMSNDSFVVTRTNPAAVRGADVLYISYRTLPAGVPTPVGAITPPLELVVEVRSPSDSPADLAAKAAEYLAAGVRVVLVLDPESDTATVYRRNKPDQPFGPADTLTLPDVLPGFAVAVADFFARAATATRSLREASPCSGDWLSASHPKTTFGTTASMSEVRWQFSRTFAECRPEHFAAPHPNR